MASTLEDKLDPDEIKQNLTRAGLLLVAAAFYLWMATPGSVWLWEAVPWAPERWSPCLNAVPG